MSLGLTVTELVKHCETNTMLVLAFSWELFIIETTKIIVNMIL